MGDKSLLGLRLCGKVADGYILLLLSAFILICSPYESITKTKYITFLVISGGFVFVTVLSLLELMLIRQLRPMVLLEVLKRHRLLIGLSAAYLLFTAISALASPYSYDFWLGMSRYEGLGTQIIYMLSLVFVCMFGRLGKWHLRAFGITMLLFCLLCWLQFAGYNPLSLYPSGYNYYDSYTAYSGEYLGTLGNADLVSALLAVAVMVFSACILCGKGKSRYWLGLPLAACLVTLVIARVAAGILAVAAASALLLPVGLYIKGCRLWKPTVGLEILLLLGGFVLLLLYDFGGSGTLYEFHQVLNGNIDSSFGSSRIHIWRQVISTMGNHLLLGTGPDSMLAWELEGFTRYVAEYGATVQRGIDVAHNEYLNIAAQQGLLAAAPYYAIIAFSWAAFFKAKKKTALFVPLAAVTAYEIQAFFCFSMCIAAPVFYVFLGLLLKREEDDITDEIPL